MDSARADVIESKLDARTPITTNPNFLIPSAFPVRTNGQTLASQALIRNATGKRRP